MEVNRTSNEELARYAQFSQSNQQRVAREQVLCGVLVQTLNQFK